MRNKVLAVFLAAVMLFGILPLSTLTVQGVTLSGPYSSDPATYIVNIALAQVGKTKTQLGYSGNWCAAFVSDCAAAAGQSAAVPWNAGVSNLKSALINAGATQVSTPRAGDIAILNGGGHCGICVDSTYVIDGNNVSNPDTYVQKSKYSWFSNNTYYRPAYKTAQSQLPGKPTVTVYAKTDQDNVVIQSSAVERGDFYDYRIYNADTGAEVVGKMSQPVLLSTHLPKGHYYVNVAACNNALLNKDVWWTFSDDVYFWVTEGNSDVVDTTTYNGHKYELYLNRLTWTEAKEKCEEKGGHLVTVTSKMEQDALRQLCENQCVWFGGFRTDTKSKWQWITQEDFEYTSWRDGEPNNSGILEEDHIGYYNIGWNDFSNISELIKGYICEYEHNHEYTSAVTTAATCTENGLMTYTCSCGDTYTEIIPAHHTEQLIQSVAATCTEGGYDLVKCANCGVRYKINETPALGHHHVFDHTVDPTCEEQGYDVYKCERCDDCYYDNYQDAIGHDYHQTRTVAATCVKDGYYIYTCDHCDDTSHTAIPALGHYFVSGFCVDCGVSVADAPFELSGDGRVDANDLTVLKEALLGNKIGALFDVNGDGETDVRDLVRMKKHFAK